MVGDEVAKVPANVAWGRRVLIHVHQRQNKPSVCHVKTGYISKANIAAAQLYQALTMCIVSLRRAFLVEFLELTLLPSSELVSLSEEANSNSLS